MAGSGAPAATLRLDPVLHDNAREPAGAVSRPPMRLARLKLAQALRGTAATAPASFEEMVLEVDVNRQNVNRSLLVLRRNDGMFLLRAEDLQAYRLRVPNVAPLLHDGAPYFPLDALPGASHAYDEARQRLAINASPDAFAGSIEAVPGGRSSAPPTRSSLGGFLNYSLVASGASGVTQGSAALESGVFGSRGVLLNTLIARHDESETAVVRLESVFVADLPERRASFRAGDSINRSGVWGRPVRFGGVQYGTNFATAPGFVTYPLQSVTGSAAIPSLVDVYINNALVATREIRPGPFSITNIPITSGSGNVRLVVRDLLNREQVLVVDQPFYSSVNLLRSGLSDHSAEAGWLREDFGVHSNHYGMPFASGTYRRGLTDRITAEVRAEAAQEVKTAGAAAGLLVPSVGVIDVAGVASHSARGQGWLGMLGWQRQGPVLSISTQAQWTSPDFHQLGLDARQRPPRRQVGGALGAQFGRWGSITLSYVDQRFHDPESPELEVVSAGYSAPLGRWAQLNLFGVKTLGATRGYTAGVSISVPLDSRTAASAGFDRTHSEGFDARRFSFNLQRNLPPGDGYGYRVTTRGSDVELAGSYQDSTNTYDVNVLRSEGSVAGRVGVSGGIGLLGGAPFLSRLITGSFGMVQVADYPNVAVMLDNQVVARTDARGLAVLPQLRAYDRNRVSVRDVDLPMDAQVERLSIEATPYYRSGVLIDFPVRHPRAAVLYVKLEDGSFLPSGAVARLDGQSEEFPVALHGEVYLNGFKARDRVRLTWKGRSCAIDVAYPETKEPLPDLGTFVCKGVLP